MTRVVHINSWRAFLNRASVVNVAVTIERRRLLTFLTTAMQPGGDFPVSIEVLDKMRTFLSLPNESIHGDPQGPLGIYSFIRLVSSELAALDALAIVEH
jgi:hypothetical protein